MNNKPWYEKVGIGVGIIASICTILAFVYSLIISDNDNITINSDNNEITIGDQSAIIVGDNNKINYGNMGSDNIFVGIENENVNHNIGVMSGFISELTIILAESLVQRDNLNDENIEKSESLSISVSYDVNPIQVSKEGIDVLIEATTSFPADYVTIHSISDAGKVVSFDMYGYANYWWFNANFYIRDTYTVTITAYTFDGESVSDTFTYIY